MYWKKLQFIILIESTYKILTNQYYGGCIILIHWYSDVYFNEQYVNTCITYPDKLDFKLLSFFFLFQVRFVLLCNILKNYHALKARGMYTMQQLFML